MSRMKELLMDVQELVYDAIEAGAKTNEDVYVYVNMRMTGAAVSLELIKEITDQYAQEWM